MTLYCDNCGEAIDSPDDEHDDDYHQRKGRDTEPDTVCSDCAGKLYNYIVHLDERGSYSATVDDLDDETVYSINNDESEAGELWIIEFGFMKHTQDMDGLTAYLISLDVIPAGSTIRYIG